MKELIEIQRELKAPKSQKNTFGKYNYRSCEDILEAVKPLVHKKNCIVILSDEVNVVSERVYVVATAKIINEEGIVLKSTAFAREPLIQKGMNEAQITGSASSYARKYALNGLFAIDDTKDADNFKPSEKTQKQTTPVKKSLDKKGFDFLIENGTKEQVQKALDERTMTTEQKSELDKLLIELIQS